MSALRLPRLQFSLRTLVIGMVIVAALASWHASRYSRFQARVAAKAELAEAGITLSTLAQESWLDLGKPKPDESWVTRWDRYWFGEEAVTEYPILQTKGFKFHELEEAGKPLDYARLLPLFPELRFVNISFQYPPNRKSDSSPRFTSPRFITTLARLPRLEYLRSAQLGPLDDACVECFPEASPLVELSIRDQQLTPQGVIRLFQKCPQLRNLGLPATLFDEKLVTYLNTRDRRYKTFEPKYITDGLQISALDTRADGEISALEALKPLEAKYSFHFHRAWNNEPPISAQELAKQNPPPWEMSGFHGSSFTAAETKNFSLKQWPNLESMHCNDVSNIEIQGCARLENIALFHCDRFRVHQNPRLAGLHLHECGALEIAECEALQEQGSSWGVEELTLRSLPQFRKLFFGGKVLRLEELPKLESVTLSSPTPTLLRELQKLPSFRNLTMYFNTATAISGQHGILKELQNFPAMERLRLMDSVPPKDYPDFLRELSQLTNLRVLRLDGPWNSTGRQNSQEFIAHLPPQLEVLIVRADLTAPPLLKLMQQRLPNLVYVAAGETMPSKPIPADLKQILETNLENTPTAEQLRPQAVKFPIP